MVRLLGSLYFLLVVTFGLFAEEGERPVPSQPFQQGHFIPVTVPQWLEETTGLGYTLSAMTWEQRSAAAEHGVTLSEMGFVDTIYPYYESKLLTRRSPHVSMERIPNDIEQYNKLGIRILATYPPTLQGEVYEAHPDWRRIATDTTEIPEVDLEEFPHGGMLCLLGPYGDFFIEMLAEILTEHPDIAAFSFDGLHYGGVCYCQHCRHHFREEMEQEIPPANLEDPAFRRYQHWADRRMEALIQRTQTRLKGIKPEVALVTWTTNAGRFGHFLSVPRNMPARMNLLLDAPDQELWLDESNRGNTIVPAVGVAYAWSITNHRVAFSEPYLMSHGNPYSKDSFPAHEILQRMMLCLTHGCRPSIAVAQPPRLQQGMYRAMDEVQRRSPWIVGQRPEPWAAILLSDNTKNFYGRSAGEVEDRYLAYVLGMFRACTEAHLPVTLINDWNLNPEDLSKYAVLILPNAASLDDSQIEAIDRFVHQGGGLVASMDTSLFDEFGDPRAQFGLESVLGVRYQGLIEAGGKPEELDINFAQAIGPEYWRKRKNSFYLRLAAEGPHRSPGLDDLVDEQPVVCKAPAVRVQPAEDAQVLGKVHLLDSHQDEAPAVVTRTHGQGRVVYLAAGIDAAYYQYAYPYQRLVLGNSVTWAAGDRRPPVDVKAPLCVQATIRRQKAVNRVVVHLYNDINTTGGKAFPTDDVPLREETLPIHDIEVTFRLPEKVTRVTLQPEGKDLEIEPVASGGLRVVVPRLEVHTLVVADLETADRPLTRDADELDGSP